MTMWTLTTKRVTCFSIDPLDLYNFDSACPEVIQYLNGNAAGIVVSEKIVLKFDLILPFLSPCGALGAKSPLYLYNFGRHCP